VSKEICRYCGQDDMYDKYHMFGSTGHYSCNQCGVEYSINSLGNLIKSEITYLKDPFAYKVYLFAEAKSTLILIKEYVGSCIYDEVNNIKLDYLLDITPSNIEYFIENRLEKLKVML